MAERDGIWSRGGVPVEELPDPFAIHSEPFDDWQDADQPVQPRKKRRR